MFFVFQSYETQCSRRTLGQRGRFSERGKQRAALAPRGLQESSCREPTQFATVFSPSNTDGILTFLRATTSGKCDYNDVTMTANTEMWVFYKRFLLFQITQDSDSRAEFLHRYWNSIWEILCKSSLLLLLLFLLVF